MSLTDILAAVYVILGILLLRHITGILPSLLNCLLRWKECLNLENSVRLSQDRNIFAAYLTVPFCLAVSEYRLYAPAFLDGMDEPAYTGCICAVFAGYLVLRAAPHIMIRKPKCGEKTFKSAGHVSFSFFCILVTVVLIEAGICSFTDVSADISRPLLLYTMLAVYLVSIFRKFQIFSNSCSFLSSFLYLCALEILPTGILVLSAVFL